MNRIKRLKLRLRVCLAVCLLCSMLFTTTQASALTINGDGSSASGNATGVSGGYALKHTDSSNVPGYRVSVIDITGANVIQPIDIYRNAYSEYAGASYHKFSIKYPKTVLKNIYTVSFSTVANGDWCTTEDNIGLTLPTSTTAVRDWCGDDNIKTLLSKFYGWTDPITYIFQNRLAVLIEPIYPVKLQNQYHSLTVTEIAVYGAALFGGATVPPSSSTQGSWAIISNYTNRYYPSSLYTTQAYANLPAGGNTIQKSTPRGAFFVAGVAGFEPTNAAVKVLCLTA